MAQPDPQPQPRGTMVDIPRVSTYFAQAMGASPNTSPGHITGHRPDGRN